MPEKPENKGFLFPKNSVFGEIISFLGKFLCFWGNFWEEGAMMRSKNYKGRCDKRTIAKCEGVCRTYDAVQYAYADVLQMNREVIEIKCNVPLADCEYTSDFVCLKSNGQTMVRECVFRKHLTKPLTVKQLDISREYWLRHGVTDWGIVIDEE
ncbi:MAG: hypothetical protein LUC27_02495 [Lachnospiraceae bacterium]|nr:hypothetical protein [Lachnospiraceae bacterium]